MGGFYANSQYFNPLQIGGLVLWTDIQDPAANGVVPADSTSLTTWVDKSSQGNNYTQATGASKATYKTNIQNGKNALLFNGTTQFYSGGTTGFPTGSSARTVVGVFTTTSITGAQSLMFFYENAMLGQGFGFQYENIGMGQNFTMNIYGSGVIATTNYVNDTPYIYEANYSAGGRADSVAVTINGTASTNANTNATVLNTGTTFSNISSYNNGLAGFFSNYMHELTYYNSSLSAAKQSLLRNYLHNKWGI